MTGKYTEAHQSSNGPGDARPTALQIIRDNGLEDNLADKVFIVTGGSAGIGVETARALAATGAKVFITVRDLAKGKTACSSFLSPGRVELLEMDNNSLASVRSAAAAFLARSDQLNVLVNNAGVMALPNLEKTVDGFETQFGINHLAHFLFFTILKDTLIKSSTPEFNSRVVNVSSAAHLSGEIQFDNYGFESGNYSPWLAYSQAKLANIYMANEIDRRYGSKGLHAWSLHPGGIWSGLQKHITAEQLKQWKSNPAIGPYMKNIEQGAATTVLLAVGKELEGKGGEYWEDCEKAKPNQGAEALAGHASWAYDEEKEARLWKDSLTMVGLKDD